MTIKIKEETLPGEKLDMAKMPGHWLLARMGKRVLRPGGLEATQALLSGLDIRADDCVVEFAPGLGGTAKMMLEKNPESYVGIERDKAAAKFTEGHLQGYNQVSIQVGTAHKTELPNESASVVIGEAMLTLNSQDKKEAIVAEAFRILKSGGRYGIHELSIIPDNISKEKHQEINDAFSGEINISARPLPAVAWRELLENAGFEVKQVDTNPMHLLRPRRVIQDEGLFGALNIVKNVILNPKARKRILGMRKVFEKYQNHISAIILIAKKKEKIFFSP